MELYYLIRNISPVAPVPTKKQISTNTPNMSWLIDLGLKANCVCFICIVCFANLIFKD